MDSIDRIEEGQDGKLYKMTITNGSEYSSRNAYVIDSLDVAIECMKKMYTKDDILDMLYKTYIKFRNCAGGEGYFEIDGVEYNTDTGYALEGMEILINHIHHHVLEEKKDVDTNTK